MDQLNCLGGEVRELGKSDEEAGRERRGQNRDVGGCGRGRIDLAQLETAVCRLWTACLSSSELKSRSWFDLVRTCKRVFRS